MYHVINYFTNSLLDFLCSVKQNQYIPEINRLEISNDGTNILTFRMEDKFPIMQMDFPNLFISNLCFMILDSFIDSIYPEMEGTNFNRKYDKLPKNDNIEIMFSQLYRILKLYRNATVHHMSSIHITNDLLKINYSHGKTNYLFTITHKGIEIIEDMVLCYFHFHNVGYSYQYKEYLYYSYYDDILKEIIAFNDEKNNILIINSTKINRIERFNCHSINYKTVDNNIIFDIPQKLVDGMKFALDINISIGAKKYIIPIEVIDKNKKMCIEEMDKFEIE